MAARHHERTASFRAKQGDHGHSLVKITGWFSDPYMIAEHRTYHCQCGRQFAGQGNRGGYSFGAHQKQMKTGQR